MKERYSTLSHRTAWKLDSSTRIVILHILQHNARLPSCTRSNFTDFMSYVSAISGWPENTDNVTCHGKRWHQANGSETAPGSPVSIRMVAMEANTLLTVLDQRRAEETLALRHHRSHRREFGTFWQYAWYANNLVVKRRLVVAPSCHEASL